MKFLAILPFLLTLASLDAFQLSVIHMNDFHGRYNEISFNSGPCKSDCIGGFSRLYMAANDLLKNRPNPLFLNAGDNFQGTLWHYLFKWNVTQHFMNLLPLDAITLGNHEFDHKIEGVVPYLEHLRAPVVLSNVDASEEPTMQGLFNKSTIVVRGGKKIGVVGVILSTTYELSYTGKLKFMDEVASVNAEARRLIDEEGVFTVIVLSHCGYDVEKKIAREATPGISVIVGAHTHTLLYNGTPPNGVAVGPYPTVVEHDDGRKVLVVQAASYSKYLGDLTIDFDDTGKVLSWSGSPLYLDQSIPQDTNMNALLAPWKMKVEEEGKKTLGYTKVHLDQSGCRKGECNLGNFVTDAMVAHYVGSAPEGSWTSAPIAFINPGGVRTDMMIGEITYADLATVLPFGSTIDTGELQGKYIKEMLEVSAIPYNSKRVYTNINLLQVSGMKMVIDLSQPEGSRVISLKMRCSKCDVPRYEDLDPEKFYRIATTSFVISGADAYWMVRNNIKNHVVGDVDVDVVAKYIKQQTPIIAGLEERITVLGRDSLTAKA